MFGLSIWWERIAIIAICVLAFIGYTLFERHRGAQACLKADAAAVAAQTVENARNYAQGLTTVYQEDTEYDRKIAAPVEHPVSARLCIAPAPRRDELPGTTTPERETDAAPDLRAADHGEIVRGPDIGPGLQGIGKHADAQVEGLQAYIRDVCKPGPLDRS